MEETSNEVPRGGFKCVASRRGSRQPSSSRTAPPRLKKLSLPTVPRNRLGRPKRKREGGKPHPVKIGRRKTSFASRSVRLLTVVGNRKKEAANSPLGRVELAGIREKTDRTVDCEGGRIRTGDFKGVLSGEILIATGSSGSCFKGCKGVSWIREPGANEGKAA